MLLQSRLFHVVDWTSTAMKCTAMKNVSAKRAKLGVLNYP